MRMRKIVLMLILVPLLFSLSGCAQLREKFVPKPKGEKVVAKRYYSVREYDVKPSLDLYTKRYVYWKNWHRELLAVLDNDNHKKIVVAAEQEISNLMSMRNMLVDEKAEQLQVLIDEMTEIEVTLKKERLTPGNEVRIRKKLETLGRQIKLGFSYTKVRKDIRDEFPSE